MKRWIVVMGVSGSGKSTLGAALAQQMHLPFLEGDQFHPPENVEKMRAGMALTDEDRQPWPEALAHALRGAETGAVLSCSALRVSYRDDLRRLAGRELDFLWLKLDATALEQRLQARTGHYMPAHLLASQLATLEPPEPRENIIELNAANSVAALVAQASAMLHTRDRA
ncbi:MAG: gluconokinase [Terricaulis sp.]|nr:gluconokinase [Terricaulis sp.]